MFNKSPSAFLECWTSFCTSWTRAWPSIVCEIRVSMQAYSAKNLKSSKCMSLTSALIWLLQLCSLTILTGRTYKMIHWTQQTFDRLLTQKLDARLFACPTILNTNSWASFKVRKRTTRFTCNLQVVNHLVDNLVVVLTLLWTEHEFLTFRTWDQIVVFRTSSTHFRNRKRTFFGIPHTTKLQVILNSVLWRVFVQIREARETYSFICSHQS